MKLTDYFQRIYLINLKRREDRLLESIKEFHENGIENYTIFEAYDNPSNGHAGCTRSHRMLLREIADGPHDRVLILEDDFAAVNLMRLRLAGFKEGNPVWDTFMSLNNGTGDLNQRFNCLTPWLPSEWDCLYLGGSFKENPISRLNKHVIRCGGMLTTSSYGITREFAKKWTAEADAEGDLDHFIGPIDLFFSKLSHANRFYVVQPRLIFQRQSVSDLDGGNHSRLFDMTDSAHESKV